MLLPSKITLLVQVYICLVNASSVFVNYLDGSESNEITGSASSQHQQEAKSTNHHDHQVRATIESKVLPEVRAHKYHPIDSYSYDNEILFSDQSSNSLIDPAQTPLVPDFESVTISSALLKDSKEAAAGANKDMFEDGLEEKIEMHTNNHKTPQQSSMVVEKNNNHNTRHYSSYQLPAKNHHQHHYPMSKYPSNFLQSNSNNNGNNNHNLNLNLNYIHSLLLTKPSQTSTSSSSSSPNSLSSMLHSLSSASSSSVSNNPSSGYLSSGSSSYYSASLPKYTSSLLEQQPQLQQNVTTATILDLSGSSPLGSAAAICGRQQVASSGSQREPRIVGGNNSYEGEFPWAVSIQRHGNHHCGGVIVGRRWILTAAHCVRSQLVGNLIVRTGGNTLARSPNHLNSHLERDYLVDQIVMHNDFSRYDNLTASQMKSSANTNNADIALLRLKHEIHWNELAWPVCFPPREAGNFSGHDAVVIGWGKLNEKSEEFSNELQKVKLTIIDNKQCQNWFRQAGREMPIDDRVICAGFKNGGKDACHGDSGGPLLSKINGHYAVVGVVSTGIGCARPLLPGLYSRVSSYISWIERHIT